jgi:hypothetical protein
MRRRVLRMVKRLGIYHDDDKRLSCFFFYKNVLFNSIGIMLNSKILNETMINVLLIAMSEKEKHETEEHKKEIKIGDTIQLFATVKVIKIRKEAAEELDKLPQNIRNEVLDEAVKITMNTIHPYDVTLEDVLEAKKKKVTSIGH